MGKGKKLIVLLLVVILLVGAYFAVTHFFSEDPENSDESDDTIAVSAMKAEDIVKIHYLYGEEDITLTKEGDSWYLGSDKSFPLNQTYAETIASDVANLEALRLISKSADDFAEYGLSEPSTAIVFTLAEGGEVTYFIGDYNSFSDSYYFNIHGEEKIYLVSAAFMDLFQKGLSDLAEVEDLTTVSTEEVVSVNMVLDGVQAVIFNKPDGLKTVYSDSYTWFANSTTPLDADASKELAGLAVAYTQSGCADYSADDEELVLYGFSEPTMTLTVDYTVSEEIETGEVDENDLPVTETKTTDKVLNLLIGGQANDGRYYAKTAQSDIVYLIDADYIENLRSFDTKNLRYSEVCLIEAEEIESMAVTVEGKTSLIEIEHSTDADGNPAAEYKLDGELLTAVDFYSIYSSIQSMVSEGITDESVASKDAYITVVYKTTIDGFSEMTLKFIPLDRSFYVVDFNGRCDILVNKRDVENIVAVINELKG